MNIEVTIIKDIPKNKINEFADKTVHLMARETIDRTTGFYPRLTGDLERGSFAMGAVPLGEKAYGIGSTVDYVGYVWAKPQNTNWTNPATLAQWYLTVFANHAEQIANSAVSKTRSIL